MPSNNTCHSALNKVTAAPLCGTAILPLKTKTKGPAPPCPVKEDDVVDEAIRFWRVNVLFKNFEPEGPADLIIAYLTVMIGEVIRECVKYKTKGEAAKGIQVLTMSGNFKIPGDDGFPLPGFFKTAATKQDADNFRAYFRQLREELGARLVESIYTLDADTKTFVKSKWWFQFSKRKFMNIEKT